MRWHCKAECSVHSQMHMTKNELIDNDDGILSSILIFYCFRFDLIEFFEIRLSRNIWCYNFIEHWIKIPRINKSCFHRLRLQTSSWWFVLFGQVQWSKRYGGGSSPRSKRKLATNGTTVSSKSVAVDFWRCSQCNDSNCCIHQHERRWKAWIRFVWVLFNCIIICFIYVCTFVYAYN